MIKTESHHYTELIDKDGSASSEQLKKSWTLSDLFSAFEYLHDKKSR